MQIQVQLKFSRSTKGTHVFATEEDGAAITNVYVKRSAIDGEPPSEVTLILSDEAPKARRS